jgi:hypothetical protein
VQGLAPAAQPATFMRINPGPFEPVVYLLQTPAIFRVVGLGGFVMFTILALTIAGEHGIGAAMPGLLILGALWFETSANVCRRCRFYGTWHCMGQGMLVSRLFSRIESGVSEPGARLHFALAAILILYEMFWLWHSPMLGFLFTLWLPLAIITATSPAGFSWRAQKTA